MRRLWIIVTLLIAVLFALVACASPVTSPSVPAQSPNPTQQAPAPPVKTTPVTTQAIPCEKAKDHIGERTTVYGIVASTNYATGSKGKPTFLNLGKPYPNQIFTVLIWDNNRKNFSNSPEIYYKGKTIYVTGLIVPYQGVPEIEVTSPSQIREQ